MKDIAKYLILFIATMAMTHTAMASREADSIRVAMKNLSGKELINAHRNLCWLAAEQSNHEYENACIKACIAESRKQKDIEAEGYALLIEIIYYYNNSMNDSVKKSFHSNSDLWRKNELWIDYYMAWDALINTYIYEGKLQTALLESTKMYNDAKSNKIDYGIGLSSYCLGLINIVMDRYEEAEKACRECIAVLTPLRDTAISPLLMAYNTLCQALDAQGKYDEIRSVSKIWKKEMDDYTHKTKLRGDISGINVNYLQYNILSTAAEIGSKNFDKAAEFLEQAKELVKKYKAISKIDVLELEARYYAARGDYKKAIDCNNIGINLLIESGDSITLLTLEKKQAEYFLKDGQYEKSARLFHNFIPRNDNLRNRDLTLQIDDMRSVYELDKLTLQNQITREHLFFSVTISALLLIIVILYILYVIRLRRKNRELVKQIKENEAAQQQAETLIYELPVENLSHEQRLFQQIKNLLSDKDILCASDLSRESIAQKLGTNSRYVAEAIKDGTPGLSVSAYINILRVKYGRYLLEKESNLSLDEVSEMCGFNSRSRFHSAFRDYYNLTPGDFRRALK